MEPRYIVIEDHEYNQDMREDTRIATFLDLYKAIDYLNNEAEHPAVLYKRFAGGYKKVVQEHGESCGI